MALYQYRKAPPNIKPKPINTPKKETTERIFSGVKRLISPAKLFTLLIPFIFIFFGLSIIYKQFKPYAIHFLQTKFSNRLNQQIISLVPSSYEKLRADYISDPGADYFSNLFESKQLSKEAQNYKGTFYLSIEKIQIKNAPVFANVDSNNKKRYEDALSSGLAHFKGTDLPDGNRNVFIYGHSAAGSYAEENPDDIVTAFTRLFKLNIGDEVLLNFKNKEYIYIIKKIKEVNPQDTDIIFGDGGKTLTLMTCSPPGLNSKRLIVVAIPK